ncbi:hypothetical protein BJX62DRAFT_245593 [Aspergillus germanicus]
MDPNYSQEIILVSPKQSSSPGKRKITPSPESSVSKKHIVISSPKGHRPQPLLSSSNAIHALTTELLPPRGTVIELRCRFPLTHAHPEFHPDSPQDTPMTLPTSREVTFEFDLHLQPAEFLSIDRRKLLLDIFPGAHRVEFNERVLVFYFDQLPAKPWPKKVAGVPCYLTDNENDRGPSFPTRHRSLSRITVADHLDLRGKEEATDRIFNLAKDYFNSSCIPVSEIQFWGRVMIIVLDDIQSDGILIKVPRSIAKCNCFYLFEEEVGRPPLLPVMRSKSASTRAGEIDDSLYDNLRPGVILSSGKRPEDDSEFFTSSGVLVKNVNGDKLLTVAAHGFPGHPHDCRVYHPNHSGKSVGEVIMEIAHTGIALVRLDEGVEFSNETFENTVIPGPSVKFTGFSRTTETRIGDNVYLDSPFSGFLEGTRLAHAILRVPSDDPLAVEQKWIRCQWHYMGQGSGEAIVDGICGSAIWDDDHKVVGFFRYAPASGIFVDSCLTVAADQLLDKGYTLV